MPWPNSVCDYCRYLVWTDSINARGITGKHAPSIAGRPMFEERSLGGRAIQACNPPLAATYSFNPVQCPYASIPFGFIALLIHFLDGLRFWISGA
jgi:hypothetical protein